MSAQSTPIEPEVPQATKPPMEERIELSDTERKFVAECEAAYEANPTELYTMDEVIAFIKRKK